MRIPQPVATAALLLALSACTATPPKPMMSTKSPVELRAMQSRAFATSDEKHTLRQVIATLQDLGYNLDKVEASAGSVSATKLAVLRMSASVIPRGTTTVVRANAMISLGPQQHQVDDPRFYLQDFFAPLSQAMLLEALPAPAQEQAASTDPDRMAPAPPPHPAGS
jgi:hypothetical protein